MMNELDLNTTDSDFVNLDEDGIPEFQSLSELLAKPMECTQEEIDADNAREEAEAESYANDFDWKGYDEWRSRVQYGWHVKRSAEEQKKIDFYDRIAPKMAEVQEKYGKAKKLSERIAGKRVAWSQVLNAQEATEKFENTPPIISLADCMAEDVPEPPQLIHGVLYRGGKLVFGGPPKVGKTWVLMDLATAVANGQPWFGKQCDKGHVLYLNFELGKFTNKNRWRMMLDAKKVDTSNISLRQMKGNAGDIASIVDQTVFWVERMEVKPDLIILDPIYKCYGEDRDENSAGDMSLVLNELDRMILELDTSVAFAAHFPKGNMAGRTAMDRISGSGVFARDPEAIVTCTPWEKQADDAFRCDIDFTVREFKDVDSIVVKKAFPLYEVDGDAPERNTGKFRVEHILAILEDAELAAKDWEAKAKEILGMNTTTFDALSAQARFLLFVEKPKDNRKGKYRLTEAGRNKLNPSES